MLRHVKKSKSTSAQHLNATFAKNKTKRCIKPRFDCIHMCVLMNGNQWETESSL